MSDILQWLNLLLIPTCIGVLKLVGQMRELETTQKFHSQRLEKLDGIPH